MIEPPRGDNRLSRHVVFVGPAGSGKSTLGRSLALDLGATFVDLDDRIELSTGRSIERIFSESGEDEFRVIEENTLAELLADRSPQVISTGGGAVTRAATRRRLDPIATVLVTAPAAVLAERIAAASTVRPLYADDPLEATTRLLSEREPLYQDVADMTVDTSLADIGTVLDTIVQWLVDAGLATPPTSG